MVSPSLLSLALTTAGSAISSSVNVSSLATPFHAAADPRRDAAADPGSEIPDSGDAHRGEDPVGDRSPPPPPPGESDEFESRLRFCSGFLMPRSRSLSFSAGDENLSMSQERERGDNLSLLFDLDAHLVQNFRSMKISLAQVGYSYSFYFCSFAFVSNNRLIAFPAVPTTRRHTGSKESN